MIENIRLIKNSDVSHLQDILLLIFWKHVKLRVSQLLGLQVEQNDSNDELLALSSVGDDLYNETSALSTVVDDLVDNNSVLSSDKYVASQQLTVFEADENVVSPHSTDVEDDEDDSSPQTSAEVGEKVSSPQMNTAHFCRDFASQQITTAENDGYFASQQLPTFSVGELPEKLVVAGEQLLASIASMLEAYKKVDFKVMSAEIRMRDEARDSLLRGVKSLVKAMTRLTSLPQQHAAALTLQKSMEPWKLNPKDGYLLETEEVAAWLKNVSESAELTEAVAVLGLTATLARLGELGEEVDQLISDRTEELSRKRSQQQRKRRKESERAWRRFVLVLNAAAVMDSDEHRYEPFVELMNYLLKLEKRQMRHIRKKHPRRRENS